MLTNATVQSKIAPFLSAVLLDTVPPISQSAKEMEELLTAGKSDGKMVHGGDMVLPKYLNLLHRVSVILCVRNVEWGHTD